MMEQWIVGRCTTEIGTLSPQKLAVSFQPTPTLPLINEPITFQMAEPTKSLPDQNEQSSAWPECPAPHPDSWALAHKICTTQALVSQDEHVVIIHLTSGWSSNDVFKVSFPHRTYANSYIVKLPHEADSSSAKADCKDEALRTSWAHRHGLGPRMVTVDEESGGFAMECLEGTTLSSEMAPQHLLPLMTLLRNMHRAPSVRWMQQYDPMTVVAGYLDQVKRQNTMSPEDIKLVETVLQRTKTAVKGHPKTPCHNDFHCQNIMMTQTSSGGSELTAIDFENCGMGDPMWDVAYLTVNLGLQETPLVLANLYGVNDFGCTRVRAYVLLAMCHCATWAATRGEAWRAHHEEMMGKLTKALDCNLLFLR